VSSRPMQEVPDLANEQIPFRGSGGAEPTTIAAKYTAAWRNERTPASAITIRIG